MKTYSSKVSNPKLIPQFCIEKKNVIWNLRWPLANLTHPSGMLTTFPQPPSPPQTEVLIFDSFVRLTFRISKIQEDGHDGICKDAFVYHFVVVVVLFSSNSSTRRKIWTRASAVLLWYDAPRQEEIIFFYSIPAGRPSESGGICGRWYSVSPLNRRTYLSEDEHRARSTHVSWQKITEWLPLVGVKLENHFFKGSIWNFK